VNNPNATSDLLLACINSQKEIIERQGDLINRLMTLTKSMMEDQRNMAKLVISTTLDSIDPEPHGSRDTFVPRPTRIVCDNMAFTPANDGPSSEQFNPLQD